MRMVRQVMLSIDQPETIGRFWEKVIAASNQHDGVFGSCKFYVEDDPTIQVSACARIEKALPCLRGRTRTVQSGFFFSKPTNYLTNIAGLAEDADVLDPLELFSAVAAIAEGMPKRFPTSCASLTLEWDESISAPLSYPTIGLDKICGTQSSQPLFLGLKAVRRLNENWMIALVDTGETTADTTVMPEMPDKVVEIVNSVGQMQWQFCILVPNEQENASLQNSFARASTIIESYQEKLKDLDSLIHMSNPLRSRTQIESQFVNIGENDIVKNFKTEFAKTFKRLGYRYDKGQSQARSHVVVKHSSSHNVIGVQTDVGGFGKPRLCSFNLMMRGLGWEIRYFPVFGQYPVLTVADWANTNSYVAEIVAYLEKTFVAEIDAVYGRSPEWLINCGKVESSFMHT